MRDVEAVIAANRFGLGARPGELAAIAADPRGWLTAQLQGMPPQVDAASLQSSVYVITSLEELRRQNREARAQAAMLSMAAGKTPAAVNLGAVYRPQYIAEVSARLRQGVSTDRPFLERITQFWSNHFAVSVDKAELLGVAGSYEREAIRPNVLGTFEELLLAVETHPAMLLYLDNFRSVGPDSQLARAASRRGKDLGINENLAREILELHTLGVDGGYTQADVTAFARVLTGWSIGSEDGGIAGGGIPGAWLFRPALHQPGSQVVAGRRYAEDGDSQGRAVLKDLARSPATAHHIATKLAHHFIADQPSERTVRSIARAFLDSDGHLPAVYRAVVEQSQAWEQPHARYKTPSDYVFSVYRGLDLPLPADRGAVGTFDNLGQRTWSPASPAGWPDRDADWDGASALMKRLQWAQQLGERQGAKLDARQLAPQLLGATLGAATRAAVERAASGAQALTLLLAAPEFMRR